MSATDGNGVKKWQWPEAGATPVNYGLDTEIFDSEKFPHVQTFVREAIQNSLDARHDREQPVIVRFAFHDDRLGPRERFLVDLMQKKKDCGLSWQEDWSDGRISWLVVEDSNSSGLNGGLDDRTGDFWNYWLNFGISNKNGSGRGGRGIGRITFLIASGISTVIGVTRRAADGRLAACGMSLLKPGMVGNEFKTSYAYLAESPSKSIYSLYNDPAFHAGLIDAFRIADYTREGTSGLSLIIPFPHSSLEPDPIIAAAIEHFAPAIIGGALVVEVDGRTVSRDSIDAEARRIAASFPVGPLREDPTGFLRLTRRTGDDPDLVIRVDKPTLKLADALGQSGQERLRSRFEVNGRVTIAVDVPLIRSGRATVSRIRASLVRTPKGRRPIDLFFREGMCLPEVSARNPADVDLVVQSDEGELVTYLNFCEGKAHLGLIENKEVAAKLKEHGFLEGYTVKKFVRRLMDELRMAVLPDQAKPDASIFSGFFSVPKKDSAPVTNGRVKGVTEAKNSPSYVPPSPLPRPPGIFVVDDLEDGFRIRANPACTKWPAHLNAEVAYADGSNKPKWSRYDFELATLSVVQTGVGAKAVFKNNVITCRDCGQDFSMEIRGFDKRRELVARVRGRHA